jgi:hypothetical protein
MLRVLPKPTAAAEIVVRAVHVRVLQDYVNAFFQEGGIIRDLDQQVQVHGPPTYQVLGRANSTFHISFTLYYDGL